MTFRQLSAHLERLEATRARLEITAQLADLLKQLNQAEIEITCTLLQGSLVPPYQSLEFQLAQKMLLRALARVLAEQTTADDMNDALAPAAEPLSLFEVTTPTADSKLQQAQNQIEQRFHTLGDLGELAVEVMSLVKFSQPTEATIAEVYQLLRAIAEVSGAGSQDQKLQLLVELFKKIDPLSVKFVMRIVMGKLRLGFSTLTLMDAVSWAKHGDKRDREALELAYQKKADIGKLAAAYLTAPNDQVEAALNAYQVEFGVPVVPALCQRLNTAEEIIEKMQHVYAEPKYDGLRLQLHFNSETQEFRAYTRNLEEVTAMFPELTGAISTLQCKTCILDAEAVGYDPKTGQILPFQATITRKRKHEVAAQAETVPIRCFVFDVMMIDGVSLVDLPLSERKRQLNQILPAAVQTATITQTTYREISDPVVLHAYHEAELGAGLEGIVIKQTDAIYRSGRKGWRWVKIKEKEGTSGKLADTVDCVVMGYYFGKGKRTAFGVGAFLLGVLSEVNGEHRILSVAKLGTGLTDVEFQELRKQSDGLKVMVQPALYQVPSTLIPNGWLEPGLVLEIAADEITESPTHAAGLSLRFPRLVRVRADKNWEQATTVTELRVLQKLSTVSNFEKNGDED